MYHPSVLTPGQKGASGKQGFGLFTLGSTAHSSSAPFPVTVRLTFGEVDFLGSHTGWLLPGFGQQEVQTGNWKVGMGVKLGGFLPVSALDRVSSRGNISLMVHGGSRFCEA